MSCSHSQLGSFAKRVNMTLKQHGKDREGSNGNLIAHESSGRGPSRLPSRPHLRPRETTSRKRAGLASGWALSLSSRHHRSTCLRHLPLHQGQHLLSQPVSNTDFANIRNSTCERWCLPRSAAKPNFARAIAKPPRPPLTEFVGLQIHWYTGDAGAASERSSPRLCNENDPKQLHATMDQSLITETIAATRPSMAKLLSW